MKPKQPSQNPGSDAKLTEAGFEKVSQSASTTECTGLAPSGVTEDAQSESYRELYEIHPPKAPHEGQPKYTDS